MTTHLPGLCIYFSQKTFMYIGDIAVSDVVRLTVHSELDGASPQFTLTCISTGGPATTVTWTRDSDTVTEETETVLDDRVHPQPDCDRETGRTLHMYCG